jgi:hypothetical protein
MDYVDLCVEGSVVGHTVRSYQDSQKSSTKSPKRKVLNQRGETEKWDDIPLHGTSSIYWNFLLKKRNVHVTWTEVCWFGIACERRRTAHTIRTLSRAHRYGRTSKWLFYRPMTTTAVEEGYFGKSRLVVQWTKCNPELVSPTVRWRCTTNAWKTPRILCQRE